MRLTMKERQSLVRVTAERYQRGGKREKRVILDEFVAGTGYHRTYASYLLSRHGRRVVAGPKRVIVGDVRERDAQWSKFGRVTALTLENPSAAWDADQKRANGNGS